MNVREFIDSIGIKPYDVTYSSFNRLIRLHNKCQKEKYFSNNIQEYSKLVKLNYHA